MAKIDCQPEVEVYITIRMSEDEAAALDALVGYGAESFLEVFYEKMGRSYLEPHEKGLRSLFDAVRGGEASVAGFLNKAKLARNTFHGRTPQGQPIAVKR